MSVERVKRKSGYRYQVRWRDASGRNRARLFDTRADAEFYEAEVRRRRQLGGLQMLDAGAETLDDYVSNTWAPAYAALLATKTRTEYARQYDKHVSPRLGHIALRELSADDIARLQAELLASGLGHETVRKILHVMLGGILRRAVESQRILANPVRSVRMPRAPQRDEVRPLSPREVERIRRQLLQRERDPRRPDSNHRETAVVSVLAYCGLRPGELRALRWRHVKTNTLVIGASKTGRRRSVRLLRHAAADLLAWRIACVDTAPDAHVFPGEDGDEWSVNGFNKWRARVFQPALKAAGMEPARPYDLRHGFASLLLHEGRSVIYVARQLGHGADLTLKTYGHVIEDLEDAPQISADDAIESARTAVHGDQGGRLLAPASSDVDVETSTE